MFLPPIADVGKLISQYNTFSIVRLSAQMCRADIFLFSVLLFSFSHYLLKGVGQIGAAEQVVVRHI